MTTAFAFPSLVFAILAASLARPALADETCRARATLPWEQAGPGYAVEAIADGPTCQKAMILYVVRRPDGQMLWNDVVSDRRFRNHAPRNSNDMTEALRRVLNEGLHGIETSDQIPEWRAEDQAFVRRGDSVWYFESSMNRAAWNALRAARRPVFSYLKGS